MANIVVGTASWTDRSLVKSGWYPKGVSSAEDRLRFYAERFPLVEADSPYYFIPTTEVVRAWIDRTPGGFTFDMKAFALLTQHPTKPDALPEGASPAGKPRVYLRHLDEEGVDLVWERFTTVLKPVHRAGKLGAILFQFPPWFTIKRQNKDYILECAARAKPFRIAVELRNHTWFADGNADETLSFLRQHEVPYVCVDTVPGDRGSVPPITAVTAKDLAVVRFHGRGRPRPGLSRQAAAGNYSYPTQVLRQWVPRVTELAAEAETVHVIFRNAVGDYAVRNAARMADLLADAGLEVRAA